MDLSEYRNTKIVILTPETSVYEVARAMAERQVGAVVIAEHGRVVGIVTDRDLVLDVVATASDPRATRVGSVMRQKVATVEVDASVEDAIALMRTNACRRLPMIDQGRVVGIVTLDDLLLDRVLSPDVIAGVVGSQLELAQVWSERNRQREGQPRPSIIGRHLRHRRRHQAHADATYAHFLHRVQERTGLKTREDAETALLIVLEGICRRIPAIEARHFLAQLPSLIREEFSRGDEQPDKSITVDVLLAELRQQIALGDRDPAAVLTSVVELVSSTISSGLMEAIRTNLPAEMKPLFPIA